MSLISEVGLFSVLSGVESCLSLCLYNFALRKCQLFAYTYVVGSVFEMSDDSCKNPWMHS